MNLKGSTGPLSRLLSNVIIQNHPRVRVLKEGQERGEIATQQTGRGDSVKCTQEEHIKTLSDIGLTRKQSSVYQKSASSFLSLALADRPARARIGGSF